MDEEQNLPAYERVWKSQNAAGYPSDLYAGEDARRFVRGLWPDFNTSRVGLALHERVSGYAGTRQAVAGLAGKCAEEGVRVLPGVEVTGYDVEGGRVRAVLTDQGRIACDVVVWGLGAWTPKHWAMLGQAPDGSRAAIRTAPSRPRTCGRTGGSWRARSTTTSRT